MKQLNNDDAAKNGVTFRDDEDGSMVVMTLFLLLAMLLMGGLAVDLMRFEAHRARLQSTIDRAVLAASNLDTCLGRSEAEVEQVVNDYATLNGCRDGDRRRNERFYNVESERLNGSDRAAGEVTEENYWTNSSSGARQTWQDIWARFGVRSHALNLRVEQSGDTTGNSAEYYRWYNNLITLTAGKKTRAFAKFVTPPVPLTSKSIQSVLSFKIVKSL